MCDGFAEWSSQGIVNEERYGKLDLWIGYLLLSRCHCLELLSSSYFCFFSTYRPIDDVVFVIFFIMALASSVCLGRGLLLLLMLDSFEEGLCSELFDFR